MSEEQPVVTIFERYFKHGDKVYRQWSFDGKKWETEETAYINPPYVILRPSQHDDFISRARDFARESKKLNEDTAKKLSQKSGLLDKDGKP